MSGLANLEELYRKDDLEVYLKTGELVVMISYPDDSGVTVEFPDTGETKFIKISKIEEKI